VIATRLHRTAAKPGRYSDGRGLYLQVTKTGTKSWLFRYERDGKEFSMGLGSALDFTLEEARDRARDARRALAEGRDPLAEKRARKAERAAAEARTITFERAARAYFEIHADGWKNAKNRAQFLSTLETYAFPFIGELACADIERGDVLRALEPIWAGKTETASRVRQRIEKVLDWAAVRGYRSGNNPAAWKGNLEHELIRPSKIAQVRKFAALPWAEMPIFIPQLRAREGVAARALEFTILTAARTGEVTGARWDEIDFEQKTWIVPAGRVKMKREHRVPLSDRALEVLRACPREDGNPHVFIGGRKGAPISNMAMGTLLKRMNRDDVTVHGFRSTFRDWAAERTNYQNHIVEMALAHVVKGVEAHYRRGDLLDRRRRLMTEWAIYCDRVPASDNVTSIRPANRI